MQGVVTLPALFSLAEAATEEFEETEVEEDKEDPSEFLKQRQKFFALNGEAHKWFEGRTF